MPNFKFGARSSANLAQCDPALEAVARLALSKSTTLDMTCTCGHRGKAEQDDAVARGCSQLKWPNSKHNKTPSLAMDLEPFPISKDDSRYIAVSKLVKEAAQELGVKLTWGGDWKGGWDKPHYELAAPSGWTRDASGKPINPKAATGGAAASSGTPGSGLEGQRSPSSHSGPDGDAAACPQPLEDIIEFNSLRFAIPASIIRAMIQVESGGNPKATRYEPAFFARYVDGKGFDPKEAKGRATSWGLMQIMGEVARELGFRGEFEELFDPATNLEWCCRLLGKLKTRLYGSFGWPAVCAAYNGGLGAVRGKDNFTNPQYPAKVLKALGGTWPE